MQQERDHPGVVAQPPLIFLAGIVLGIGLDFIWPLPFFAEAGRYPLAALCAVLGIAAVATAVVQFRRGGTNVPTWLPTTTIISYGLYRITRNPIYIGVSLVYAGIALAAANVWMLGLLLPVFLTLHFGVVLREERYLEAKFGDDYRAYKARVRRWI